MLNNNTHIVFVLTLWCGAWAGICGERDVIQYVSVPKSN